MSDLTAFGIGIGMGLLMMTVVVIFLRDELVAGFRRLFEEPGKDEVQTSEQDVIPTSSEPHSSSFAKGQRRKMHAALCFNALATSCLFGFGLLAGDIIATLCGAIGLVMLAIYVFTFRNRGSL